jgi:hypothetical protein
MFNLKIYVDASNSFLVRDLKNSLVEEPYVTVKQRVEHVIKDHNTKDRPFETLEKYVRVLPVPWNKEGTPMMLHSTYVMERNQLRIDPAFDKLITSLRTASEPNKGFEEVH